MPQHRRIFHVRHSHLFQRRRVHPGGESDPDPQGIARRLCPCRAERRLAHRSRRKSRGLSGRDQQLLLATASADGQPYIQHRGGPKGFVKVLDKNTLAFADYSGNRQYITQGNLSENPKAHIFVMDYAHRRRVKIWGEARVVDDDPALTAVADAAGLQGAARTGRSCSRSRRGTPIARSTSRRNSMPPMWRQALAVRDGRIAELEAELAALKGEPAQAH